MKNIQEYIYAHTLDDENSQHLPKDRWQTLEEHHNNTAILSYEYAVQPLKDFVRWIASIHDLGKAQPSFQLHLEDKSIRVEHSVYGAQEAFKQLGGGITAIIAAHCIAGHHTGLSDTGIKGDAKEKSTLFAKLSRTYEDCSQYMDAHPCPCPDVAPIIMMLQRGIKPNDTAEITERAAFITRYSYSCLCDADSIDTMRFCNNGVLPDIPKADFIGCLEKLESKFSSFSNETELQKARSLLQKQVFDCADEEGNVFLLNMPTGSGKTLCSIKLALQRAVIRNKKRIIYISSYNAIIDQTADVFEDIFKECAQVVRHQSTFSYDDREDDKEMDENERQSRKYACENWDGELIVSTTVQFFETVASSGRGKLRKLHNMADSIIIMDEVHTLPIDYLQPCLKAISYITTFLNSEAIFMTATMPDYRNLLYTYGSRDLVVTDLVKDKSMFNKFSKCDFRSIGTISDEQLLMRCQRAPSCLVIVNKKKTARKLYNESGFINKFHLSTYMTAQDRASVIKNIRERLDSLEKEYPGLENVPEEKRIVCFSTSLVEAGVDFDFSEVYRELAGLDSILQSGGRCNREGKRKEAHVFVFERNEDTRKIQDIKYDITRELLSSFPDISDMECISEYYKRLFFSETGTLTRHAFSKYSSNPFSMNFREYDHDFHMIEDRNISVFVPNDEKSRALVDKLRTGCDVPERALQQYTASVALYELSDLKDQGVISDCGTGVYCLTNPDYYTKELGIGFEGQDKYI